MRNRLVILNKRLQVQIGHIIARLVVIAVIRHARLAAKQRLLFRRLNALGAREEPARGDAHVQEGSVIGAAAEFIGHIFEPGVVGEIILEELLRLRGAGGAREAEGGAVAVVDAVFVVGRGDHVEVEFQPDLGPFGVREGGDVECGAEEAEFFGGDPDEADGVVDAVFGELDGDFQDSDSA